MPLQEQGRGAAPLRQTCCPVGGISQYAASNVSASLRLLLLCCPHRQIKYDCLALHGIASRLREARFKSGALRLNNTRLYFALDTGGNPVSASPYMQTAANFLVEEYMLLANMRVAAIIARAFPKHALLR